MSRVKMKPRTPFVRAFKECTNRTKVDKVAIFDVDNEEVDYVDVDTPEPSHCRSKWSKEQQRKPPLEDFINIDDDEGNMDLDNENGAVNTTSRNFHQPSTSYHPFFDVEDDECQMVFDKGKEPVDLANDMNSRANSSRIFPSVRRFSVSTSTPRTYFDHRTCESDMYVSDSSKEEFSESEDSDCEIINDSSGIESWERAAKKKRKQDPLTDSEIYSSASESIDESSVPFWEKPSEKSNVESSSCQKQPMDCSNSKYAHTFQCDSDTSKMNLSSHASKIDLSSDQMESFAAYPDNTATQVSNATPIFSVTDDANCQTQPLQQKDNDFPHHDTSIRHSFDKAPAIFTLDWEQSSLFESTTESSGFSGSVNPQLDNGLVDPASENENNLVGGREKHKESEEFKRAAEAEWTSRQEQLRIQAEEAQRLRKRKKAESLRLLEMEKRLKQRLEEVRESQKKVEETVNLKEKIRADIRIELARMELLYKDMPSLLRALGVNVGGGHFPSSKEVQTAYRRAALRFHPDRASRTDVRQQVEAEEKFKLISRMKEKWLPVTW